MRKGTAESPVVPFIVSGYPALRNFELLTAHLYGGQCNTGVLGHAVCTLGQGTLGGGHGV